MESKGTGMKFIDSDKLTFLQIETEHDVESNHSYNSKMNNSKLINGSLIRERTIRGS
jgi:hypothetical protein